MARVPRAAWKAAAKARRSAGEPVRSCCVCRARRPWSELIFLNPHVSGPVMSHVQSGAFRVGAPPPGLGPPTGVLPEGSSPGRVMAPNPRGRGAWVCRSGECVARLERKGALGRAFRGPRELLPGSRAFLAALASGGASGDDAGPVSAEGHVPPPRGPSVGGR
ncbi:MAG: YlxR family protein [Deltaproteobacteria bacterium]|nr:YlxR family protein [Deltaproteobacteria bacterium]